MLASSGAEGLRWPALFSGVFERTAVFPGPAVEGLPPGVPEGSTPAWSGVGEGWAFALWSCDLSTVMGMSPVGVGARIAHRSCLDGTG